MRRRDRPFTTCRDAQESHSTDRRETTQVPCIPCARLSCTPTPATRPPRAWADNSGMNPDAVACTLWSGSPCVAVDPAVDPLPDSLSEFVTTYLVRGRPAARA